MPTINSISVIIPCLNGARFLRECLRSALAQDYNGPTEVIVADDGSCDQSEAIARTFAPKVRLLPCPKGASHGCGAARNRAVGVSTGALVALLDADDLWLPGHLSALASAMLGNAELGMACDNGLYVDSSGDMVGAVIRDSGRPEMTAESMLLNCFTDPSGVMLRRTALEQVGGFAESPDLLYVEDHDLWLRVLETFPAAYVPIQGYCYRLHSEQVSSNPLMWRNAENVLARATTRYAYRPSAVRKRRAVLAYRNGEVAIRQRRLLRGGALLGKAAFLDPGRAIMEIANRVKKLPILKRTASGTH